MKYMQDFCWNNLRNETSQKNLT